MCFTALVKCNMYLYIVCGKPSASRILLQRVRAGGGRGGKEQKKFAGPMTWEGRECRATLYSEFQSVRNVEGHPSRAKRAVSNILSGVAKNLRGRVDSCFRAVSHAVEFSYIRARPRRSSLIRLRSKSAPAMSALIVLYIIYVLGDPFNARNHLSLQYICNIVLTFMKRFFT